MVEPAEPCFASLLIGKLVKPSSGFYQGTLWVPFRLGTTRMLSPCSFLATRLESHCRSLPIGFSKRGKKKDGGGENTISEQRNKDRCSIRKKRDSAQIQLLSRLAKRREGEKRF